MARLSLPAVLASVDRVRSFLQESLAPLEPREDDFFKIELAVVELCVNISRYAYPNGAGEMAIEIETDDRTATVMITDEGIPFDPRSVPKPDVSWILATGRTGGLGIYLARTLTDRFDYKREDGRNVLTLAKKF